MTDDFASELRRALHAEGDIVNVDRDAAWVKVQAEAERRRGRRSVRTVSLAVLAAAAMVAVALAMAAVVRDGGGQRLDVIGNEGDGPAAPTTATTEPYEPISAELWPFTTAEQRRQYMLDPGTGMFFDAEATALEFAREYLGMPDPVAEEAGGAACDRCERFAVRPRERSPMITFVDLQRDGAEAPWSVMGAAAKNIDVDRPASGDTVANVITVTGRSSSYEAHVDVEVRQDGQGRGEALGRTYVMGGSTEKAAFAGDVTIDPPTERAGAVILSTSSAEDGSLQEATVVRVLFGDGGEPSGGLTRFSVFFHRGDDLVEVGRESGRTTGVLRAALDSLFAGPQPEDGEGLSSLFSAETADLLAGVSIDGEGTAVVDIARTVDNASTSAGSEVFLAELDATVFQFSTVKRVEYRLDGDCDAFWQWLQRGDCRAVPRPPN